MSAAGSGDSDVVQDGDFVVIHMHEGKIQSLLRVCSWEKQKIDRTTLNVKALIGAPYGSMWEMINKEITRIYDEEAEDAFEEGGDGGGEGEGEGESESGATEQSSSSSSTAVLSNNLNSTYDNVNIGKIGGNRDFNDTNTAQKMDHNDIANLKASGSLGSYQIV